MTRPDSHWPEAWRSVAAAIRRSAATGQAIGAARDLARAAGLPASERTAKRVLGAMRAAGVLACERGAFTTWILPQEGVRSATGATQTARRTALQQAIEDAARAGRPIGSVFALGAIMGMRQRGAAAAIRRALARGVIVRELRAAPGGTRQARWGLPGLDAMTPWAPLGSGVRDMHAARKAAAPPKPKPATGPLPRLPDPAVDTRPVTGAEAIRRLAHKIQLHRRRCEAAVAPTEAEMRALIDRHIAERGVTRTEAAPAPPGPVPVRPRGRATGDGHARIGGR